MRHAIFLADDLLTSTPRVLYLTGSKVQHEVYNSTGPVTCSLQPFVLTQNLRAFATPSVTDHTRYVATSTPLQQSMLLAYHFSP